ncbi:MAG: hypothetical protein IT183_11945 [Acidobacteria bacterium]|nr:hypothetical protein [Acidobacteriota bacterium]
MNGGRVRTWPWLLALSLLLNVALAARYLFDGSPGTNAALRGMPLDDAFIHLVYGRSIAQEGMFAYNPGQPETGATSPLWAALLALPFWLERVGVNLPIVEASKGLGVFFSVLQGLAAGLLAWRLHASRPAAVLAVLIVATCPALSFARVSGMELPLAGALLLFGLHALAAGRTTRAAVLLGLAPLARPELALALPLVPLTWLAARPAPTAATRTPARVVQALLLSVPSLAWAALCLSTTGRPLPITFYAKHRAATTLEQFADLPGTLVALVVDLPMLAIGLGIIPLVIGTRAIARAYLPAGCLLAWATACLPFVLLLGVVWAHDLPQPLAFYWYRYVLVVVPLLGVWIALGIVELFVRGREVTGVRGSPARVLAAVTGGLVAGLTVLHIDRKAELYAWNCQNIAETQVTIGRWAAQHVPPDRVIATVDAGAVRYYSNRRTLDLLGLNDHRVLDEGFSAVVQRERPAAYVVFPALFPAVMDERAFQTVFETRSPRYTICNCPQDHMVVRAPR